MKHIIILIIASFILFACNENKTQSNKTTNSENPVKQEFFGEKITPDSAIAVETLQSKMGNQTEFTTKVSGVIDAVCQKKGCWMELKNTNGENVRVTFKDYGFFVPKDCQGKTAIVDGIAKIEITSVEDLKEYAKDDGKSKEEIAAITEPLKELVFEAKGVILQ